MAESETLPQGFQEKLNYVSGHDDGFWGRPPASNNPDYLRGYADGRAEDVET